MNDSNKITVVKEFTFDSAHQLPGYDGPCANLHGHTYKLQVGVAGDPEKLDSGMVADFKQINEVVQVFILDKLDHKYLNDVMNIISETQREFPRYMPTAELMVLWIRDCLLQFEDEHINLEFIRLYETPTSWAEWRAE